MNIVFMSLDTLPSTLWARDLYDQMHIRSDFRKWFPRMCQYGFIEGRDYEYMPRVRLQDEGGRTVQRYVKDYRITQDMAKKLCKLHHTAVSAVYHPQPFDWDALLGLLHKKAPRRSSYEAQLSDSDSLVTTTQIAKEYGCGAYASLLVPKSDLYRCDGKWKPPDHCRKLPRTIHNQRTVLGSYKPQTAPRRIRGCVCSLCGPFQFSLLLRKNVKFRDWQVWPLILSPCG